MCKKYKKCIFYKTNSRDEKSVECIKKIHSTKKIDKINSNINYKIYKKVKIYIKCQIW